MYVRVLHVVDIYNENNTGIYTFINTLVRWSISRIEYVDVITYKEQLSKSLSNKIFNIPRIIRVTLDIRRKLIRDRVNIIHIHGIWHPIGIVACVIARCYGVRVILSPHGMLQEYAFEKGGVVKSIKKKMVWKLYRLIYAMADVIHVLTNLEMERVKAKCILNKDNTILVKITTFVDISDIKYNKAIVPDMNILFLGRIHPIKNISILIESFRKTMLKNRGWTLYIVGPYEDQAYAIKLKKLASSLGSSVKFLGEIHGLDKYRIMRSAWVTVLPSHSEVGGIVNLESAMCGTPTITTFSSGLDEWNECGGELVNPTVSELSKCLLKICKLTISQRLEMGRDVNKCVSERYAIKNVGLDWLKMYHNILT